MKEILLLKKAAKELGVKEEQLLKTIKRFKKELS